MKKQKHQKFVVNLKGCSAAETAANRARIAEQERRVRLGLLQPVYVGLGNAAAAAGLDYVDVEGS